LLDQTFAALDIELVAPHRIYRRRHAIQEGRPLGRLSTALEDQALAWLNKYKRFVTAGLDVMFISPPSFI
jgi:hypothetical protein